MFLEILSCLPIALVASFAWIPIMWFVIKIVPRACRRLISWVTPREESRALYEFFRLGTLEAREACAGASWWKIGFFDPTLELDW